MSRIPTHLRGLKCSPALVKALLALEQAQYPAVEAILELRGFSYEAGLIKAVIEAWKGIKGH